ncbi:hypothetical protein [uncultured Winogradskyella sp.]|uniref:hypothetical protein n=1 Tax=uncultured Winogradskyella sp. TaxID=395353 RepID=UPI002612F410|nr:hypothetical protein [uncultured Winogradskyella sp.]
MKQGEENTKFIKEEDEQTSKYIFQKNTKTKFGFVFFVVVLVVLILGVILTGFIL